MVSKNVVLFVYLSYIYVENCVRLHLKLIGIESVLAQTNKILNQTLNIHTQIHLVEGSRKDMKF